MKKVFEILSDNRFKNKKVLEKLIIYHLWWSKEDLYKNLDFSIPWDILKNIIKDYEEFYFHKKPLEYILWYVEFKWLKFDVNSDVLIPRPETEYMIDSVIGYLDKKVNFSINLIDLWTWCWVLWLTIKKLRSKKIKNLILTDISENALKVARSNALRLFWDLKNIFFIKSDLLSNIWNFLKERFILVANLPYIPDEVFEKNVEDNVKKWEPSIAFLWWKDGLNLYRRVLNQLIVNNYYKNLEIAFFEMMSWQAEKLKNEYKIFNFKVEKTFHFNIVIVSLYLEHHS